MKKFWLIILFIISACSTSSEDTRSILDKSTCTLPCWNDIVMGQTTEDEFLQIIERLPDIDQGSIRITNQRWNMYDNQIYFSFQKRWSLRQNFVTQADIYIIDNIVTDMSICRQLRTNIGEIVNAVGEPESIITGGAMTGGKDVILIWSEAGLSVSYNTNEIPESQRAEISPEIEIICLDLFDSDLYYKMMDAGFFSMGYYNAEETLKAMYPWNGYGNLNEKYPFRNPKQP